MSKNFRRTFVFGFVFAIFSIMACLGGISLGVPRSADAAVSNAVEIKSAEDLENRIKNYGAAGAVSNYVLTDNIDMAGRVLHNTIGNETNPFRGTFDGQGFTIRNLTFDMSTDIQGGEVVSTNKYVGLFGITDGATISNIQITGTTNITIGDCTSASVGVLVGSARNTTIKYIQNTSSVRLDRQTFNHSLIFGGLVGSANSTNISYVINRQNDSMAFNFVDNNGRISTLGGVVGTLSESSLVFGVAKTNMNITIADTFVGTVNVGGVFGTVSGSGVFDSLRVSVVNMLAENNLTLSNNQPNYDLGKVSVGQVGGAIVNPYPATLGVSSIYYKKNSSAITAFGQKNGFNFVNETTSDNVLETNQQFSEAFLRDPSYRWYPSFGGWDFDAVWYSNAQVIYLQSFYGGFRVELASNLKNSSIFNVEKEMDEKYIYESTAEIVFSFKESDAGENLSHYYTLTGLKQGNTDNKVLFDFKDGVYSVSSDPENYSISEKNGIYTVTIKNVNRATAGTYDLSWKANEFKIEVTSKLYDADGVLQDGAEQPANIYYVGGTTAFKNLDINLTYNGTPRTIEARLRSSSLPYALEGWYLENEGGEDILLATTNTLEINFGTGHFTDNRKIYAKYRNDACRISFDIKGDGIAEIYVGENLVHGKVATVSKTASRLKLEIYVKDGYEFDVKRFLDMISTYRGEDTTNPFCTWTNEESGDENYYVFNLDMTTLKGEFAEEFSVIIDTEKAGGTKNNMIWYIVGGVGGAVVLGVVIFLIIFFVKKKGSGGGGKLGGYGGRKSFKGGYY